jgi:hypothetical protein
LGERAGKLCEYVTISNLLVGKLSPSWLDVKQPA